MQGRDHSTALRPYSKYKEKKHKKSDSSYDSRPSFSCSLGSGGGELRFSSPREKSLMQGLRKGFLTLHSRRSGVPNFCNLYPEYRFFPSTISRSEISANPVARVVVNSRIPSRNSAFSRTPHCVSAKSRIPRMLDSSLSSVKT